MPKQSQANNSISYTQAIALPDKQDDWYTFTPVKWDEKAEQDAPKKEVNFYTIGKTFVTLLPSLPQGYVMEDHPSWQKLIKRIYNSSIAETYSFDYMDAVTADFQILYDLNIKAWDNFDLHIHPEYCQYLKEYSKAWEAIREDVEMLCDFVLKEPEATRGVKLERRMPPSKVEVLKEMLRLAELDENIGERS